MSTHDRRGQVFLPGFLTAVWHTPVISEGEFPGGGGLFASCTRALETAEQLPLAHPCGRCGAGEAAGAAGLCAACDREADDAERDVLAFNLLAKEVK